MHLISNEVNQANNVFRRTFRFRDDVVSVPFGNDGSAKTRAFKSGAVD